MEHKVERLMDGSLSDSSDVSERANKALRKLGKRVVPVLLEKLKDKDPNVQKSAAHALSVIGADAVDAVPGLIQVLKSRRRRVWLTATKALARLGEQAIPGLRKALKDEDGRVSYSAAEALGMMGAKAAATVPALSGALTSEHWPTVASAAEALGKIGPRAMQAAGALAKTAKHPYWEANKQAITSLGKLGPKAIPVLQGVLQAEKNPLTRMFLFKVLSQKASKARAKPLLLRALKEEKAWQVRVAVLGELTPKYSGPVPVLRLYKQIARNDPAWQVRAEAANGIGGYLRLGKRKRKFPKAVVSMLWEIMATDKAWQVRAKTISGFSHLPLRFFPVVLPSLTRTLKDPAWQVRYETLKLLYGRQRSEKLSVYIDEQGGPEVVSWIVAQLKDPAWKVRLQSAKLVGRLGPRAASGLPGLRALLGDKQTKVREAAHKAFPGLGSKAIPALLEVCSQGKDAQMCTEAVKALGDYNYRLYELRRSKKAADRQEHKAILEFRGQVRPLLLRLRVKGKTVALRRAARRALYRKPWYKKRRKKRRKP